MISGIIGRKVGMTQLFGEDGAVTPVTVIKAGPCVVVVLGQHRHGLSIRRARRRRVVFACGEQDEEKRQRQCAFCHGATKLTLPLKNEQGLSQGSSALPR